MRNVKRVVVMAIVAIMVLSQVGSVGARPTSLAPPHTFQWKGYTWRANSWDDGYKCFDAGNVAVYPDYIRMKVRWDDSLNRWCGSSVTLLSNLGYGMYMTKTFLELPYQTHQNGLLEGHFLYRDESNAIVNEHFDPHLVGEVSNARFVAAFQNGIPRPGAAHDYWDETTWVDKQHMTYWSSAEVVLAEWYASPGGWILNQAWGYSGAGISSPPLNFNISLEVHRQEWVPWALNYHIKGFCFAPPVWNWCST